MESTEHENYYDNKFHIFEELKMEGPDTEVIHSDSNVNNEIVSEDKELLKFNDQNKVKHEFMENGLPLNVTIKTERIDEEEILDNNKDMSVPYKLTVQDVQFNSDERLLKNNVNLLKSNNEQSNMATFVELNELHKCKHCDVYFNHRVDLLVHISLIHNKKTFKCELCGIQLTKLSYLKRHIILLHKHKEPPKVAEIIFKCTNCNSEFTNRLTLNDHARLCQKEEEVISYKSDSKCEQNLRDHVNRMHFDYGTTFDSWCGKQYCSPEYLSKHKIQCHVNTNKEEHKCKSCSAVFTMKRNLIKHMKSIHYDYGRKFDCWCGKQFRSPDYLRDHKRRQHERNIKDRDNVRFQCESCQKIFKTRQCLVNHIKILHYDYGRTFDCWCGKQFRTPDYLRDHKRRQHERKIKDTDNDGFQCDSCQKIFKKKQCLVIHIKRVHYEYGRTFDCWCGKQYRSPLHLYRHKWQHERKIRDTDNDRFQCDSCQKIFKSKDGLVKHMKRLHYEYGRTFDCWCGNQFQSPLHLNRHKWQHEHKIKDTDNGRFECDRCKKILKSKGGFVKHMKSLHYDYGRTFDCWCGKQYRSPLQLYRHKWQHEHKIKDTDKDKFQCDSCQKILKSKDGLVKHIKSLHYDYGRTFDCWCGKQFGTPVYLRVHKRKQHERNIKDTENDRFRCDSCQKILRTKGNLVRHIKSFHYDYGRTFDCWCGKQFRSPIQFYDHKRRQHES